MLPAPRALYPWQLRTLSLPLGERTLLMGIVNCTPDSFSDGGLYNTPDKALQHALSLLDAGADILDIGGESTRPGAAAGTPEAISAKAEQERILPLIEAVLAARPHAVLSVDTYRAETARAAVAAGVEIVNDVSGMQWDPAMAATCADLECGVIAMHTRGLPSQWQAQAPLLPEDLVATVKDGLCASIKLLLQAGCKQKRILLDPGFGFGKRGDENWALLRALPQLADLKYPLLAGLSRKGFLRSALPNAGAQADLSTAQLDGLTVAANTLAVFGGAHAVRVHNVEQTALAVAVADRFLASS